VADLINQSLEDFLDAVAEDTPAPGGGTSSAMTVALAAALVEMAARIGSSDLEDHASARAAELRGEALRLAQEELTSYAPVLDAKTPADRTTALDAASEPPAQIAETAAEVAELGLRVAGSSSPAVRGDALTGVILADAAAAAATRLVETNISSGPVFDRAREAAERASNARDSATAS
jgi:methenyltetrahydrofolate cyclohydrolase